MAGTALYGTFAFAKSADGFDHNSEGEGGTGGREEVGVHDGSTGALGRILPAGGSSTECGSDSKEPLRPWVIKTHARHTHVRARH